MLSREFAFCLFINTHMHMHMHIFRIMEAYVCEYCGGGGGGRVFEQLARHTMRYQESDLHLGLYSS